MHPPAGGRRSAIMLRDSLVALLLVLPLTAAPARADDAGPWLRRAAGAERRFDAGEALRCYLAADAAEPGNAVILQKIARQYSDLADDQPTLEQKRRFAGRALEYAQRAVQLAPANAANVLSLAISHAKLALWSDLRTKVADSRLVEAEAERAVQLDPHYAWAHHILGRWNYEVAELSGSARLWVRLFYGGLPPASTAEAVRELQRAVELEPEEPAHRIELGFAYLAAGQPGAARTQFEAGLAMPIRARYDEAAQARARAALAGLDAASR